jgi:hypothetical protein
MTPDDDALRTLVEEARNQPDLPSYIQGLVTRTGAPIEDLQRFVAALAKQVELTADLAIATDTKTRCSFCLRKSNHVPHLVVGSHAAICSDCVELARETVSKDSR